MRTSASAAPLVPVAAPLDEHLALALEDDRAVVLRAPVLEADDARVLALGAPQLEHLGEGADRVAVEDRRTEAELVEAELGERVLGRVLGREPDHDRAGDEAEDDALAERRLARVVLVVVRVGRVHHELRHELVLDLADRRATRVRHALADGEVLEPAAHGFARGR
jgi:hypothetical protein